MALEALTGHVEERSLEDEMRSSYLDYAMSVIVGRALPDVRDGLKPVHRRVLYAMHDLGLQPNRPYRKCAFIVGEVMGKYHPHGDSAIYDTLVRLAQDFSMRYPSVDGQGNFGSIDDDPAAAMRYCVSGDTRVATEDGTIRIDELAAGIEPDSERNVDLRVLDRLGRPVWASKVFHSGDHPTLRLRTREGYELSGTENHPVLCLADVAGVPVLLWKLLAEISPGDRVLVSRSARPSSEELGDRELMEARLHASVLAPLARTRSAEKSVPERVWAASPGYKREFLRALFTGDGSSSLLPRRTIQVSYSTYSEQLARDVQLLLLEFGVVCRLCRYSKGEVKVVITNRRDARLFARRVGFLGAKQDKLAADLRQIPASSSALSRDHVPYVADYIRAAAGATGADRTWLARHNVDRIERWERDREEIVGRIAAPETRKVVEPLVTGAYYYAEVASVEAAGTEPVYSIRVESEDHSFLTNGFVSHNTEARLAPIATEMLQDIDEDTVDFGPNYDERTSEPHVLPSRFPNLLVNGAAGIAVGMATNIPPHNIREVVAAIHAYVDNPEIDVDGLLRHIKGPDFPGGGTIQGREGIRDAYASGRGSIRVRAKQHVEEIRGAREAIIVTELPYMVKKGGDTGLITKIAELVRDKKIPEISDIRDESDRSGMRIVIELKRGSQTTSVVSKLYKHTPMQSTFGVNMVALVDGVPRTLSLKEVLHEYIGHQREVITRRTQHRLREAERKAHIREGLLIALDNLDAVIALIRGSEDPDAAKQGLVERFDLTAVQAQAILDMRLQRLTRLQAGEIKAEYDQLQRDIAEYRAILGDEQRILDLIKDELAEAAERYGDPRRTEIGADESEISIEDMIADQQMVISITASGYVKRLPLATYRQQHRGGVGVMGMNMKDDDYIEHLHICSTHDFLLFFTNRGKVYRLKVYELPEGSRTSKGRALVNLLPLAEGEQVTSVIRTRDFSEGRFLMFATARGLVKKTEFKAYDTPIKADGIIAIKLREGDELVSVRLTSGEDDILLVSRKGRAVRFNEDKHVRAMGRGTSGVRGMNVGGEGDGVLAMDIARDDAELLVVTEAGYGKRTRVSEYPVKGRGTKGVLTLKITERKGALAGALTVREHHELLFISQQGMVQRTSVGGISVLGRATQGVRLMNLREGDEISAVAPVVEKEADSGAEAGAEALEADGAEADTELLDADDVPEASAEPLGADGDDSS